MIFYRFFFVGIKKKSGTQSVPTYALKILWIER